MLLDKEISEIYDKVCIIDKQLDKLIRDIGKNSSDIFSINKNIEIKIANYIGIIKLNKEKLVKKEGYGTIVNDLPEKLDVLINYKSENTKNIPKEITTIAKEAREKTHNLSSEWYSFFEREVIEKIKNGKEDEKSIAMSFLPILLYRDDYSSTLVGINNYIDSWNSLKNEDIDKTQKEEYKQKIHSEIIERINKIEVTYSNLPLEELLGIEMINPLNEVKKLIPKFKRLGEEYVKDMNKDSKEFEETIMKMIEYGRELWPIHKKTIVNLVNKLGFVSWMVKDVDGNYSIFSKSNL